MLISEWKPILYIVLAKAMRHAFDTLMDVCSPSLYRYALGIVRSRRGCRRDCQRCVLWKYGRCADLFLKFRRLMAWMRKVTLL